jgi:hypothetical protein
MVTGIDIGDGVIEAAKRLGQGITGSVNATPSNLLGMRLNLLRVRAMPSRIPPLSSFAKKLLTQLGEIGR